METINNEILVKPKQRLELCEAIGKTARLEPAPEGKYEDMIMCTEPYCKQGKINREVYGIEKGKTIFYCPFMNGNVPAANWEF